MVNYSSILSIGFAAGLVFGGSATGAAANHYYGHGCGRCAAPTTSIYYRTIHPTSSVTRYRDVSVYRRVPRIHRIVQVTRVQPIVRIHEVTRVHHHTIYYTRNAYASVMRNVAPIHYVTHSVVNTYDCGCHP